jgi:hypothetical protein
MPLLPLDAILLTRESVKRERVIDGGRGDQKCRVGDKSGIGAYRYLLMEQGPATVAAWSRRMKRRWFHFFAHVLVAPAKTKKGRVYYNRLFFASKEVSITTNFVCPSIPYDELPA